MEQTFRLVRRAPPSIEGTSRPHEVGHEGTEHGYAGMILGRDQVVIAGSFKATIVAYLCEDVKSRAP